MIDAARYLVARTAVIRPAPSTELDVTKVAHVGHWAQGAGGSVNTATKSGGLITVGW
ncbi:hypothetical protein [Nonomuraea dietziae]|uniref:hypothetical protein n=1 Tax=Nonomuraea dietziae TaxID=65515 RepID=UPI0031E3E73C